MLTTDKSATDKIFDSLKGLDNESKKRLIIKLTESIEAKPVEKIDLRSLFGAWEDNRDADQIIKDIRDSRVTSL
ncbi:MAG: hypothetical protein ACMVP2_01920 [Imperialibacter sp.]|uniref:hypothetical protein n=1 Tax=Imperialibacter sp. TaxID=2038411 RepID=UPI003A8AFEA0